MTNPYDPNQGSWQGGQQGRSDGPGWNQGGQPGQGDPGSWNQAGPGGPGYGQQPGQPSFGWQPEAAGGGQPTQGYPGGPGQFGWQPPGPPPGPGGWPPAGPGGEPPRRRTNLWVALGVVLVLVVAGVVTWVVVANKSDNTADGGPTSTASMTPPVPPSSADAGTVDTTAASTTAESTTAESTTEQSTAAESTAEESTTAASTTEESTAAASTTEVSTTRVTTAAAAVKVKVGDCVHIENATQVDLNEAGVACSDPTAVYRITVIGTSKSACDKNEANWSGIKGGLTGKTLCLLPTLKQGDCFRTAGAANGDYEKIPCAEAKAGDSKVAYASTSTADVSKCAKNTSPYEFPKRKVLYCFAKVS
ncbi:LppU/SCO3897 family protein [Nakamurella lactea]|uniref:LppU/SCO3897 family protein n=1 Tax=Nakamurella lactea TaxID=459515 RepID=UPI0004233200|nr:hypothetical protein [Nakamurella lactea]